MEIINLNQQHDRKLIIDFGISPVPLASPAQYQNHKESVTSISLLKTQEMGTPNMNDENGNEHHLSTATSSEQENASDNERPLNELDMISISDAQVQEIPNLTVPHNNDAQVQEIPNLRVPHNNDAQVQEISNLTVPHNRDRRGSLPPVFEQHHVRNNKICGKILRVMGDDHFSKACGKHLRFMGDEMCLSYELRNHCLAMQQDGRFHTSSSLPDLRDRREI